jgi:hypothetical protein
MLDHRRLRPCDPVMPLSVGRDHKRGWICVRVWGALDIGEVLKVLGTACEGRGSNDPDAGIRGHVAIVALDDAVYTAMLHYETRRTEIGVRVIRVFRL